MFYDNSKELERITELEEQYAAAQRALDAEREKVKEYMTNYVPLKALEDVEAQLATLQAQLRHMTKERDIQKEVADNQAWHVRDLKAQLRQAEGQSQQQAEEAVIVFAKYTTLRQLVEALPVVDGRMDVECGACYYIRSFIAGQYGVVCGLITEQSTAMAIKALLEYRATQAAQDAGAKLPAWVNEAMRLAPTQTNPPHPTEERS